MTQHNDGTLGTLSELVGGSDSILRRLCGLYVLEVPPVSLRYSCHVAVQASCVVLGRRNQSVGYERLRVCFRLVGALFLAWYHDAGTESALYMLTFNSFLRRLQAHLRGTHAL
jgi:hypothetical protein